MKPYLDLFLVDHVHTTETDCCGNPNIVPEHVVEDFFKRLVNVDVSDPNHRTGEVTDADGHKIIHAHRIFEDDDALSVADRIAWNPSYGMYVLTIEPEYDKIPDKVKNSAEHMAFLNQLQGKPFECEDIQAMLDTLTVSNVHIDANDVVKGYDNTSASWFIYTPVKDTAK